MSNATQRLTWRRRWLWALPIVLVVLLAAYPIGMAHAYLDHIMGHQSIKVYGLWRPVSDDYAQLLRSRYNVHVSRVAYCEVWGPEVLYANGYNSVAGKLISRRYSKDVFEECFSAALQRRHRKAASGPT